MHPESLDKIRSRAECLVEPVLYGDIFDFPPTLEEIHRFCRLGLSWDAFNTEVQENEKFHRVVESRDGMHFLKGRESLVEKRKARIVQTEQAWSLARKVIGVIRYVPFIHGVLVTGSLAVDNARRKDDLDFLVITGPRRLWMVFFVLGILQRIFSRRFLCPNYYISSDHLRLSRHTFYIAREAAQARGIFNSETCRRFFEANRWIENTFPNAAEDSRPENEILERKGLFGLISRSVEWLLDGKVGDLLEGGLKKMLKQRLFAHYSKHGQPVPDEVMENAMEEVELRFHGLDHERMIYEELAQRKEQVKPLMNGDS